MTKKEVVKDAHGREINLKFDCLNNCMMGGVPHGLDGSPFKTVIVQKWRSEKYRMDYNTSSNVTTGNGYHLKEIEDLIEHVKDCLAHGHIIEIHPDYDRPIDKYY